MLYEIAHIVKDRLKPVWNLVECGNAQAFSLVYRKGLKQIPGILAKHSSEFTVRLATEADSANLAKFFEDFVFSNDSTKAVDVKTLENGDYYIEFLPKKDVAGV